MSHLNLLDIAADTHTGDVRPRPAIEISSAADLQLSVSHNMADVEPIWRKFERTADLTVFQTYDWLSTWQRHIGSKIGVTPAIVVGGPLSDPLFILPLATRSFGPLRELTFLGTELCDYNGPLLASEFAFRVGAKFPELWKHIGEMLQRDPPHRHDLVRLEKLSERVGAQANPFMQIRTELNPSGAYATELGSDWETYLTAKRSNTSRRRDRTKRRKLAEFGEVRLITAMQPDEATEIVSTLIEQKQKSLARMGVGNMFALPGYREFYTALATEAAEYAHVCKLQVGDSAVATNLGLRFGNRYYYILASYDDGPTMRYGAGATQLQDIMQHACRQGARFFDFTIGDESYKRDWCEIEIKLVDHVAGRSLAGKIVVGGLGLMRRLKRSIKQSAWAWPLVLRARARLSALKGGKTNQAQPDSASDQ